MARGMLGPTNSSTTASGLSSLFISYLSFFSLRLLLPLSPLLGGEESVQGRGGSGCGVVWCESVASCVEDGRTVWDMAIPVSRQERPERGAGNQRQHNQRVTLCKVKTADQATQQTGNTINSCMLPTSFTIVFAHVWIAFLCLLCICYKTSSFNNIKKILEDKLCSNWNINFAQYCIPCLFILLCVQIVVKFARIRLN